MPISFTQIPAGTLWSRPQLAQLWGYGAYQALARGVVTPAKDNKIVLFVTEEKQLSSTNYRDLLSEDILQWEGPNDHFAEQRMLKAATSGDEIHLFHRRRHHSDFEYRGLLSVLSFQINDLGPSKFIFEVLDSSSDGWTRDQLLAAFYLYLQLKPSEVQATSENVAIFARSFNKPPRAVATKIRAFASLDPTLSGEALKATGNVTPLDKKVWDEFQTNWTQTTIVASEAFEAVAGDYWEQASNNEISAGDLQYLFQEGQTREAIVQVRKNQYIFRKAILSSYASQCCISGLQDERLLIASHIVPWAEDKENRLNPKNGLCLSALHDRAYDQGLITVLPDHTIRVAKTLKAQQNDSFMISALLRYDGEKICLPGRFRPNSEFLALHAKRFGFI